MSKIITQHTNLFAALLRQVLVLGLALFVGVASLSTAYAQQQAPSQSRAIAAVAGSCPQGSDFTGPVVANCDCYPGLANRIVGCIRQTLHDASFIFFDPNYGIHSIVAKAIGALLVLAVAIYGVMLASGLVEKLNRDTFILLIKIGFISYFVVNTQQLYELILAAIDALATSMFQFSSPGLFGICMEKLSIWERMDCMVDSVIGIKTADITSSNFQGFNENFIGEAMQRGLIATFFEIMKSSSFGFVIGIMGFIFIYTMLFFMVKVLFAFLTSFISLTFLLMIGPIFIPLVIFRATKQYFDKWVRLIIASALQPILLVAFITFAVAGMDLALFTGPTSITRVIAGNAAAQPGFSLTQYVNQFIIKKVAEGPGTKGESNAEDFSRITGTIKGVIDITKSECLSNTIGFVTPSVDPNRPNAPNAQQGVNNLVKCTREKVNQLPYNAIDIQALAAARQPFVVDPQELAGLDLDAQYQRLEQAMTQEIFASVSIALMLMFLMHALMKVVPVLSNDLTGEYRYTPSFFVRGNNQLGSALSQQVSAGFSGLSGSNRSGGAK